MGPTALIVARVAAGLLIVIVVAYGTGALWFRGPNQEILRFVLIGLWLVVGVAALIGLILSSSIAPLVFVLAAIGFAAWWATVTPIADRSWAADVSRTLGVQRDGSMVRLTNVRHFAWRTRRDFSTRWETREYDLDQLVAVDLVLSYWMGPAIAHTLVSFAFADGRHLVFSVEVRRLAGERFSAIGGLFRQNELELVAADERDIIRTRTNIRGENVYLYRVALPPAEIQTLFRAYLDTADQLRKQPRFYNTLTSNCTTLIYDMVKPIEPGLPWNWRLLASGYLPEYIYDLGALDTRLPMDELRRRGHINDAAIISDVDGHAGADFSNAIRRDLPAPEGSPSPLP